MPTLYSVVYHAKRSSLPNRASPTVRDFHAAEHPFYDVGDDPSFFSARRFSGPVTWGVCRPDVRSIVAKDDWVVFFSVSSPGAEQAYHLVAVQQVHSKIAQTDIFRPGEFRQYSKYLNLLVRPEGRGWRHYEPLLNEREWHADWLWRLCRQRGLRKSDVTGASHSAGQPLPFSASLNYVVFSRDCGFVLDKPLRIATYRPGSTGETWLDQYGLLREAIFNGNPRALRTRNRQQPHRHFKRVIADSCWLEAVRSFVSQSGLGCRKKCE